MALVRTRVQVALFSTSGMPQDRSENVWHVDDVDDNSPTAVFNAFASFYQGLEQYIASTVSRVGVSGGAAFYDIDQPEPRVPYFTSTFGPLDDAADPQSLPQEVSLCSSFRAFYFSGFPPARARGRIYFGPLSVAAGVAAEGGPSRPSTQFQTDLAAATEILANTLDGFSSPLCVYSRTDDLLRPVVAGWVDNEWDTQRRRGREADNRESWTLS